MCDQSSLFVCLFLFVCFFCLFVFSYICGVCVTSVSSSSSSFFFFFFFFLSCVCDKSCFGAKSVVVICGCVCVTSLVFWT